MILIADSGSTKTDWRLWDPVNNDVFSYSSKGLNPYFVSSGEIATVVGNTIPSENIDKISNIYFYGSGCGSADSKNVVLDGLQNACSQARIEVSHDLMGAARALLGNEAGIACILGTGSNACYYNGKEIVEEGVSYGFIMGDEGSGNHLGRLLLKSIFSKKAPVEIREAFGEQFPELDLPALLRQLYHLPSPNKFLAGFSPFLFKHRDNDFVKEIIHNSFNQFIDEFVVRLSRDKADKIGFQGGIAYIFRKELTEVFRSKGLNPVSFLDRPIEKLLDYHKSNNYLN